MPPVLLTAALVLATAVITCLGFRMRGGLWGNIIGWGATTARLLAWALPVALLSWYWYQLDLWLVPAVFVATWLGTLLPWWGSIDMGRNEGTWIRDLLVITGRGVLWTLAVALVFLYAGFVSTALSTLVAGAMMGIWYEIGWRIPSTVPGFSKGPELGEAIFGFVFGLALCLPVVL